MFENIIEILLALIPIIPFCIALRLIFDFLRSILFKGWTEN